MNPANGVGIVIWNADIVPWSSIRVVTNSHVLTVQSDVAYIDPETPCSYSTTVTTSWDFTVDDVWTRQTTSLDSITGDFAFTQSDNDSCKTSCGTVTLTGVPVNWTETVDTVYTRVGPEEDCDPLPSDTHVEIPHTSTHVIVIDFDYTPSSGRVIKYVSGLETGPSAPDATWSAVMVTEHPVDTSTLIPLTAVPLTQDSAYSYPNPDPTTYLTYEISGDDTITFS